MHSFTTFLVLALAVTPISCDKGKEGSPKSPEAAGARASVPEAVEPAAPAADAGYRSSEGYKDVVWGMTVQEVSSIVDDLTPGKGYPMQAGPVAGLEAETHYIFLSTGPLASVSVDFSEYHPDPKDLVQDYDNLSALLESKYGKPVNSQVEAIGRYKDRPKMWPVGVVIGKVNFFEHFSTDDTIVAHSLSKEGHRIQYVSRVLFDQLEKQQQAEQIQDAQKQRAAHLRDI